jgi:hypothetical protein
MPRCDCWRLNADGIEQAVWGEVKALLGDGARLHRLAERWLERNSTARPDVEAQIETLDRKVRRLERALGEQIATLLARGIDDLALDIATTELQHELDDSRQNRAHLAAVQAHSSNLMSKAEQLWRLASHAMHALDEAEPSIREQVVRLLDVRVDVIGWLACSACGGSGRTGIDGRSRSCPGCLGCRHLPRLVIAGALSDDLAAAFGEPPVAGPPIPFEIAS